jgi:hypothetical protein
MLQDGTAALADTKFAYKTKSGWESYGYHSFALRSAGPRVEGYLLTPGDVISSVSRTLISRLMHVSEAGTIGFASLGSGGGHPAVGRAENRTALKDGGFVLSPQVNICSPPRSGIRLRSSVGK